MKISSSEDSFLLSDGNKIPCIGFGTFGLDNNKKGQDIIKTAISLGYRHFDTASLYGSEEILGKAIKASLEISENLLTEVFMHLAPTILICF